MSDNTEPDPEGTRLAELLGSALGGPDVSADPGSPEVVLPVAAALTLPADEFAILKRVRQAVAEVMDEGWYPATGAKPSERVLGAVWPSLKGVIAEAVSAERERADAAEGKLATLAAHNRGHLELSGSCCPHLARENLAIIGSEGEAATSAAGGDWRESLEHAGAALWRVRELATAWATPEEGEDASEVTPRVGRRVLNITGTSEGVMVKLENLTRMAGSWIEPGGTFSWPEGGVRLLAAIKGGEVSAEKIRDAIIGSEGEVRG